MTLSDQFTVSLPESMAPLSVGTRDAARLLNVSERTLAEMVKAGKIPYVQLGGPGGKIQFRVATLDRWLAEQETTTPPEKNPHRRSHPRQSAG